MSSSPFRLLFHSLFSQIENPTKQESRTIQEFRLSLKSVSSQRWWFDWNQLIRVESYPLSWYSIRLIAVVVGSNIVVMCVYICMHFAHHLIYLKRLYLLCARHSVWYGRQWRTLLVVRVTQHPSNHIHFDSFWLEKLLAIFICTPYERTLDCKKSTLPIEYLIVQHT